MNFLERLVAEWYEYQGYFVRSNVHFGKRTKGGWTGEIDVAAYDPITQTFVHLEVSTDARNWTQRKDVFQKKFDNASKYYDEIFRIPTQPVQKIVIVGFTAIPKNILLEGITLKSIPDLIAEISEHLRHKRPANEAVPENFQLLRAVQFTANYGRCHAQ
jgi:hypothetical protein